MSQFDEKEESPPPFEAGDFQGATSDEKSQPGSFATPFACITLNMTDCIRFINFPREEVSALYNLIQTSWPKGAREPRLYGGSQEVRLHGSPWSDDFSGNNNSRRLIRKLLETLFDRGWILQAGVDMSKKDQDKDTLVFRYQSPPPPPCDWLCISFDTWDKLKFVEAPSSDLAGAIFQAFESRISKHEPKDDCLKLHFRGSPWYPDGEETVSSRLILMTLLEVLERFGYTLYGSICAQNGHQGTDADVLIVHRQKDWSPGAPIWHR